MEINVKSHAAVLASTSTILAEHKSVKNSAFALFILMHLSNCISYYTQMWPMATNHCRLFDHNLNWDFKGLG